MINEYNEDENFYNFLLDDESQQRLVEAQIESAEERGERRGERRGEKRGIKKTKLETAKSLLKDKIPYSVIERATGLSREYLQTIRV